MHIFRGEYISKKIWNCLSWNLGYFETVCPGQPVNLQNCCMIQLVSKHKANIFQAMLNIIYSHCAFNIKETQVCVWVDVLPRHHIFSASISSKTVVSQVKISETVYSLSGFWNCLAWKGQTTGFFFTPGSRRGKVGGAASWSAPCI